MFKGKRVIGIIPARGGSKRLPKKNIALIGEKPLIGWTIDAGQKARNIDRVIVSTDDEHIGQISRMLGADEVVSRPPELATDDATTSDVILQTVDVLASRNDHFGYIVLLQPTSPFRNACHIDESFSLMHKTSAVGVVSVCNTEKPIEWMGQLDHNGFMDSFIKNKSLKGNTSTVETGWQINGAIYIVPIDRFLEEETFFLETGVVGYKMDRIDSIDIDEEYDLNLARLIVDHQLR